MHHPHTTPVELEGLRDQVRRVESELNRVEGRLLGVLSRFEPDRRRVAELERRRDELRTERARLRAAIQHLQSQRLIPKENQLIERLEEINRNLDVLSRAAAKEVDRLGVLSRAFLLALEKALETLDEASALQTEAEVLSKSSGLPQPKLPTVPAPDLESMAKVLEEANSKLTNRRGAPAAESTHRHEQ